MNPDNITRAEALERSSTISTRSYEVVVDLSGRANDGAALANPETTFLTTTTARFSSTGQPTWIDCIAVELLDATLDGEPISIEGFNGTRLPIEPTEGEHELVINSLMRYSRTGEGLHRFVDPADDKIYLYSQFETADARRMYATFEQPDLKATFQLTVIAPSHWEVFSNSITPEPTEEFEGYSRWTFPATQPISTYITALVAGDFHVERGTITSIKGEIPAAVACRASMAEFLDADRIRTTADRGFEVYENAFGHEYAFDKYDQIFVPEFNAGAMENAGCVTFRDQYVFRSRVGENMYDSRDNTILHELGHMWFGDLVTMKWWDDLWLNESFAEWCAYFSQTEIAKKYGGRNAWTTFATARKGWAYSADQLPTTHPIAADMVDLETVDQSFDGITYAKGASVLKQLVSYVGQENFLAGVRAYFHEHAWGNTQFSDLLGALEKASGRDLSGFAGQWLETEGVNTVKAEIDVDENGTITRFEIVQSAKDGYPTLRTHLLNIGLYDLVDGKLVCQESLPVDIDGERTPIEALKGRTRPALVVLNDQDLSYVKVRFDDQSLATIKAHLADMPDPMARVVVWTNVFDAWRDAEIPSADFLDITLRGARGEDGAQALRTELASAQLATTAYAAPENRATRRSALIAGLTEHLMHAEPGDERQLAFADALINAVNTPAGAQLIEGWLNDEEVPEGLVIDADRRWAIITSLAGLGAIDEAAIAAEEKRDQTISGAQAATGARAALATADAKAEAWRLATEADLPNHTYTAVASHFWLFGQEELTAGYADKYLKLVEEIADTQGPWVERGHALRQAALLWLWPNTVADEAWVKRVEDWMDGRTLPEQVRRVLADRLDVAKRQLKAQALDAK